MHGTLATQATAPVHGRRSRVGAALSTMIGRTGIGSTVIGRAGPIGRSVRGWALGPVRTTLGRYAGPALSLAILAAALIELGRIDLGRIVSLVPARPSFWAVFVLAYMLQPLCDWAIYRRLWAIPPSALIATMRKTIGNELLFGYVGEAYLYSIARKRGEGAAAAFKAVRDVALLSSAVGSVTTLTVLALAWPWLAHLSLGISPAVLAGALAVIAVPPIAALALRSRLSLPGASLARIAGWHAVRAGGTVMLTAVLWHLAMPAVAVSWWLILSAVKLLVSRLPFVSNRELIFAGITSLLLGHAADVTALMAMMAALMVAAHVLAGIGAGLGGVAASGFAGLRGDRRSARRASDRALVA
ncbi:hypothetical protein [Sphingomonas bacterium]|uniref:hypothetical protein n=1 Tax=Sphingomonas bacterium TaxID=1895847 RepID=UPI001575AF85|nr:hypothetical protein [Sphingomonas bacterium]